MTQPVSYVELNSPDLRVTVRFFTDVFTAHPVAAAFFDMLAAVEGCLLSQGRPRESAGLAGIEFR